MQNLKFRLAVDGLDERCLPSVTPDMVYTALVHQSVVRDEIEGVIQHLSEPKTTETLSFLPTHLRERANSSQIDINILADYLAQLQSQLPANPSLHDWVATIASAEYQAALNTGYAEFYALAYGAPPRVTVPPPSVDNGVNFGSTLPFSLTDPAWQTVSGSNGVRIWDVTTGTGTTLALGNHFTATYTGYLKDGTIFDSGTLNNTVLNTSGLIKGFVAGLTGMKVGGTRRIDIPASEAYGSSPPSGSKIPVDAELVFEVKLTAVTP